MRPNIGSVYVWVGDGDGSPPVGVTVTGLPFDGVRVAFADRPNRPMFWSWSAWDYVVNAGLLVPDHLREAVDDAVSAG